jgi:hypothetical protein
MKGVKHLPEPGGNQLAKAQMLVDRWEKEAVVLVAQSINNRPISTSNQLLATWRARVRRLRWRQNHRYDSSPAAEIAD